MKTLLISLLLASCAFAQKRPTVRPSTASPAEGKLKTGAVDASLVANLKPLPLKPPGTNEAVSPDLEIRYWRAAIDFNGVKPGYDKADAALKEASADLLRECGQLVPIIKEKRILCSEKPK